MSPFERLRGAHLTAHPALEDFVFSVLSVLVLIVAIVTVSMPQSATVTVASAAPKPATKNHIVMYGSLRDTAGLPVVGADIVIRDIDGPVLATTTTDALGDWDVRFRDERAMPKTYTVEVTVIVGGQPVTGSTQVEAITGMMWGMQLVFSQPSTWVFVPLPGY